MSFHSTSLMTSALSAAVPSVSAENTLIELFRQRRALCLADGRRCGRECPMRQMGYCLLADEAEFV